MLFKGKPADIFSSIEEVPLDRKLTVDMYKLDIEAPEGMARFFPVAVVASEVVASCVFWAPPRRGCAGRVVQPLQFRLRS